MINDTVTHLSVSFNHFKISIQLTVKGHPGASHFQTAGEVLGQRGQARGWLVHGDSFEYFAVDLMAIFQRDRQCESFMSILDPFELVMSFIVQRVPSLRQNLHGLTASIGCMSWRMCALM
jgi:hypothetical protein